MNERKAAKESIVPSPGQQSPSLDTQATLGAVGKRLKRFDGGDCRNDCVREALSKSKSHCTVCVC